MGLKRWWTHPLVRDLNVESTVSLEKHRRMILEKPILKWVYERWYNELKPHATATSKVGGPLIELGSGAGFLDQVILGVVTTDIDKQPYADRTLDAQQMDLPDASVRCFFGVGVMHHFEDPEQFLKEVMRCLMPGGRLALIEPHNGFFNRFLCSRVDHYEYLDPNVVGWKNINRTRMLEANLALPWVIFVRDRVEFEKRFPSLKIIGIRPHTFLCYALSGGMTYRSFLPSFAMPLISAIEWIAGPWMSRLGTAMTVVIEKRV